jgi:transcriptional regulator with XRE-family HTH domain
MAKYDPEIVKEICSHLEKGLSQKDSARFAGISESTLYEWMRAKSELSESIELALTKYRQKLVEAVNVSAIKDGKFALEVLARRWPREYGRRDLVNAPNDDDYKNPALDFSKKMRLMI